MSFCIPARLELGSPKGCIRTEEREARRQADRRSDNPLGRAIQIRPLMGPYLYGEVEGLMRTSFDKLARASLDAEGAP